MVEGALLIYNALNVWTDIRWRKTKNAWHLCFAFLFIGVLSVSSLNFYDFVEDMFWGFFLWLLIGLLFEQKGMFAPGDTKMLMVNAVGISVLTFGQNQVGLDHAMYVYGGMETAVFFLLSLYQLTRRFGMRAVVYSLMSSARFLGSSEVRMPGAVPISVGVLLTIIIISLGGVS